MTDGTTPTTKPTAPRPTPPTWARSACTIPASDSSAPRRASSVPMGRTPSSGRPKSRPPNATRREPCVRVPAPPPVEEGRGADAHEPPQRGGDEDAVLEREPGHGGARELVRAEHARTSLVEPQVELAPGASPLQRPPLEVQDQRLPGQVLARHRHADADATRIEARPGVEPVRLAPEHGEATRPEGADLGPRLGAGAGPTRGIAPGARGGPNAEAQRLRQVHVFAAGRGVGPLAHLEAPVH